MLDLIYVGFFDYLVRHDKREASHLPDDIAVEEARRNLKQLKLDDNKETRTMFNRLRDKIAPRL